MNKNMKKFIILFCFLTLLLVLFLGLTINYFDKRYTKNINGTLSLILNEISNNNSLSEEEIIKIVNSKEELSSNFLARYGINTFDTEIVLANKIIKNKEYIMIFVLGLGYLLGIVLLVILYHQREEKKLKNITKMIQKINKRDYSLEIDKNEEGEISCLQNELYKTALVLNEQNNNLLKDKTILKDSLSDISHQLKTPLTSVNIMLENLLDSEKMSEEKKKEFIKDIYHKTSKINFLILELLKLSRFDADAITFEKKKVSVKDILDEVVENVSVLCDLKNMEVLINDSKSTYLVCDKRWQIEALTNIVKNCVEHSSDGQKINISYEENSLFTKIIIEDFGCGINKEDIKHIFDRFYKGINSSSNSIGIGLSLAKVIIEKDNGYIVAKSQEKIGTKFIIKYLK